MVRIRVRIGLGMAAAACAIGLVTINHWVPAFLLLLGSSVLIARARHVLVHQSEPSIQRVAEEEEPSWTSVFVSALRSEAISQFVLPLLVIPALGFLRLLSPSVAAAVPEADRRLMVAVLVLAAYWLLLLATTMMRLMQQNTRAESAGPIRK